MNADDETNITEIDLLPDGRICVFGTSLDVLEVLDRLQCGADDRIRMRLGSLQSSNRDSSASATTSTQRRKREVRQ